MALISQWILKSAYWVTSPTYNLFMTMLLSSQKSHDLISKKCYIKVGIGRTELVGMGIADLNSIQQGKQDIG